MTTHYIYISPHLDDVVLSCGGLVYEQARNGGLVEIWTLTAGSPPEDNLPAFACELHQRWEADADAVVIRRQEDLQACQVLGALPRHLDWQDCIYRFKENGTALIQADQDLFDAEPEPSLVTEIAAHLKHHLPQDACLVVPMGIGSHIDHRLAALAVQASAWPALYYADYPYVIHDPAQVAMLETEQWQRIPAVIMQDGLQAWQDAIAAYKSQLSTFWADLDEMKLAISNYCAGGGGRLWHQY